MLYVHTADRVDLLVGRLAEVLAEPPDDPLAPEWLATPTDGLRRWVSLELARHLGAAPGRADGVAANIIRAYPDALRRAVLAADPEGPADGDDPWDVDRMVWAVLEVLEALDRTQSGEFPAPSYGAARVAAELFDRYHLHRPDMVRRWMAGEDVDGLDRELAPHFRWQPGLWRAVRGRLALEAPPERLARLLGPVASGYLALEVPQRLCFFGFSALPTGAFLDVARAVGAVRDVHLFVPDPTRYDDARLLAASPVDPGSGIRLRAEDTTSELAGHPLARSWGRLHRESSVLLAAIGSGAVRDEVGPAGVAPSPATLLERLQHHIHANVAADPAPGDALDPADRSVRFHACFGRIRQVEVARDAILHELTEAAGALSEDDVVVVCPAIDRFAPLIEAVFGRSAAARNEPDHDETPARGAPALRYRIADRSLGAVNPVFGALTVLLDLVAGRFDVASVVDFLALTPVRHRFGFGEEDLALVTEWAGATNVRCGVDPDQRSLLGIPASLDRNTWRSGLDRLVAGAAIADRGEGLAVGDVLPLGVERLDQVEVLGRVAEAVDALAEAATLVDADADIPTWVAALRRIVDRLFAVPRDLSFQMDQVDRALGSWEAAAAMAGTPTGITVGFAEVRRILLERTASQPGRADFFRGGITVTSTRPLRWVPAKLVVLLGMDEVAFGVDRERGDDLTQLAPQVGDRDARGDTREALLETVLSATDRLIVIREGHDVRTNQPVPMAVITAELRDALLDEVPAADRERVRARFEVEHPRHGFDERCFIPDGVVDREVWGFDAHDLEAARARRRASSTPAPFVEEPLPADPDPAVELVSLQTFFRNPAQAFLIERLGARLPRRSEETKAIVPPELDGLESWAVASRLLDARMGGRTTDEWLRIERRRGSLPPEGLGDQVVAKLVAGVDGLLDAARDRGFEPGDGQLVSVDAPATDGVRVLGAVRCQLGGPAPGPVHIEYSRYKPAHKMRAWLELMALAAWDPSVPWRALVVSRAPRGDAPFVTDLSVAVGKDGNPVVDPGNALGVAVDCYQRGLREPLPWFPRVSPARMAVRRPAMKLWHDTWKSGDGDDPAVALAFGGADYETVLALPARADDPGEVGDRVGRFAKYLCREVARSSVDRGDTKEATGEGRTGKAGQKEGGIGRRIGDGIVTNTRPVTTYDRRAPLPQGKLAIEASAGTGKTFALTELACRFLAEGRATTSELLIVTFTRAATHEVRGRIRRRLVDLVGELEVAGSGRSSPDEDDLVAVLRAGQDLGTALDRVRRAVSEFDAATVTTIHGFAGQMLGALGVSAGVDGGRLLPDTDDLRAQVGADVIIRAAAAGVPADLLPSHRHLVECVRLAMDRPDLDILPHEDDPSADPAAQLERLLIHEAVDRAASARRRAGTRTFDDLLVDLRTGLRGPQGPAVVDALRRRFRAVLIDEFQDTDGVQWDIFSTVFDDPAFGGALVLVGDPKQAIYGFRGADIHTYLRAVEDAGEVRSLAVNWRSDPSVLRALDLLLGGATFGSPEIGFVPVEPPPGREDALESGDGHRLAALDLRVAEGEAIAGGTTTVDADPARSAIHADMVRVVIGLLEGACIRTTAGPREIAPADIAVLVPSHARAKEAQQAFQGAGIPAVVAQSGSVLDSRAADHLRWLLGAMARPADPGAVRMFALSWFKGWSPARLDEADEDALADAQEDLRRWGELLTVRQPAEVFATVWAESKLGGRVLGLLDGERHMTDLGHLVEYLAAEAPSDHVGAAALLAMLDKEPRSEEDDTGTAADDPVASRVATDAPAVVIMTIHTAKGLEFPIVLLPHLWQSPAPGRGTLLYPEPATGRWTLDLRPQEKATEVKQQAAAESMGERLRLLYVALTRAQHRTVLWWAPGYGSQQSALARILFRDRGRDDGTIDDLCTAAKPDVPDRGATRARLEPLVARSGGTWSLTVVDVPDGPLPRWPGRSAVAAVPLSLARAVLPGRTSRRWSFSAMVEDEDLPEAAERGAGDEGEDELASDVAAGMGTVVHRGRSPLAHLPAGARFGNVVHAVLEEVDFAAADLGADIAAAVDEELAWRSFDLTPVTDPEGGAAAGRALLVEGLAQAIRAPVGDLTGGRSLADFGRGDRLTEVSFDLRLATAGPATALGMVAGVLRAAVAGDPVLEAWADALAARAHDTVLSGHLTGSIDLVLRVPAGTGDRFLVCDYKTNALDPPGSPATAAGYRRENLSREMARHDYPLQAALYSVALHRYLRWRVPGYDPDVHLGGVVYLFVRGMIPGGAGPDGAPGVFDWRFPPGVVAALSDVLDGADRPDARAEAGVVRV